MKIKAIQYVLSNLEVINTINNDVDTINDNWDADKVHKLLQEIKVYATDTATLLGKSQVQDTYTKNALNYIILVFENIFNECENAYPKDELEDTAALISMNIIKSQIVQLDNFINILLRDNQVLSDINIHNILEQSYLNLQNAYDYAFDVNGNYEIESAYIASSKLFATMTSLEIISDNLFAENLNEVNAISNIKEKVVKINDVNNKMYDHKEEFIDDSEHVIQEIFDITNDYIASSNEENSLFNINISETTSNIIDNNSHTSQVENMIEDNNSEFRKKIKKIM